MKKRVAISLIIAIIIHLLLATPLFIFYKNVKPIENKPKENRIKIALKDYKPKKKPIPQPKVIKKIKKVIKPKPIPKPKKIHKVKKIVRKKIVRKKIIHKKIVRKKIIHKKIIHKKIIKHKKVIAKPIRKIKPKKKIIVQKVVEKNTTKTSQLYSFLSQDMSDKEPKQQQKMATNSNSINQNIKQLYGDTFNKLSKNQQEYILDNQEVMRRITQRVLTRVAKVNITRDLNMNTTNVIEFYLYPNGDMKGFRFLKHSGVYLLDETTKETIEYAYSQYPRPKEKTLIRYNVFYNLQH